MNIYLNLLALKMNYTENILRKSAETFNGWTKLNKFGKMLRTIRIGNQSNCNNDGLICDLTIEKKLIEILNKYNINPKEYEIINIHTKFEYSYQLDISEEGYEILRDNLIKN